MNKVTRLILVRHGQTVWNKLGKYQGQADIELSETGLEQAELLGKNFAYPEVRAVYASPLKRAAATGRRVRLLPQLAASASVGRSRVV